MVTPPDASSGDRSSVIRQSTELETEVTEASEQNGAYRSSLILTETDVAVV